MIVNTALTPSQRFRGVNSLAGQGREAPERALGVSGDRQNTKRRTGRCRSCAVAPQSANRPKPSLCAKGRIAVTAMERERPIRPGRGRSKGHEDREC